MVCVHVYVCVRARARQCVRVRVLVRVCVRACACTERGAEEEEWQGPQKCNDPYMLGTGTEALPFLPFFVAAFASFASLFNSALRSFSCCFSNFLLAFGLMLQPEKKRGRRAACKREVSGSGRCTPMNTP